MIYSSSNGVKYLATGAYNVKSYLNKAVILLAAVAFCMSGLCWSYAIKPAVWYSSKPNLR